MQQEQPEAAAQGMQQDPQQRVQQLEAIVQGMQGHIETLMHRTSPQLRLALQHNARCARLEHSLLPVPHPDTGALPPNFPATYQDLEELAEAEVDGLGPLLQFYGLPLDGDWLDRKYRLKAFIGLVG